MILLINNYLKHKCFKCTNQKTKTGLMDKNKNKNHCICCLQETHLKPRESYRLKVRGQKKIFNANGDQNKTGVSNIHI